MKVRRAKKDIEHIFTEELGEKVKCPVCRQAWNTDLNGDVTPGECEHLRFYYFDDEFVKFYGDWNKDNFKADFSKLETKMLDDDGAIDVLEMFKKIKSDDVDEIVYITFGGDPMYQPLGLWGYKR